MAPATVVAAARSPGARAGRPRPPSGCHHHSHVYELPMSSPTRPPAPPSGGGAPAGGPLPPWPPPQPHRRPGEPTLAPPTRTLAPPVRTFPGPEHSRSARPPGFFWIAIVGAIAVVVGAFLPWVSANAVFFGRVDTRGVEGDGIA